MYTSPERRGKNILIYIANDYSRKAGASVVERVINGVTEYAAVFPELPVGTHTVYVPSQDGKSRGADITIFAGQVAEMDERTPSLWESPSFWE